MMCFACNSSVSTLVRVIRGGSIGDCTSMLSHWPCFMIDVLVSVYGVSYVPRSEFVNLHMR